MSFWKNSLKGLRYDLQSDTRLKQSNSSQVQLSQTSLFSTIINCITIILQKSNFYQPKQVVFFVGKSTDIGTGNKKSPKNRRDTEHLVVVMASIAMIKNKLISLILCLFENRLFCQVFCISPFSFVSLVLIPNACMWF